MSDAIKYFVINGARVDNASCFPSTVKILSRRSGKPVVTGSGVIVSDNIIITAAHVVCRDCTGSALLGIEVLYDNNGHNQPGRSTPLSDLDDPNKFDRHIKVNPGYNIPDDGDNDIAVIKVNDSLITHTANAAKIANAQFAQTPSASFMSAAGWGRTVFNGIWGEPTFVNQAMQHISGKPVNIVEDKEKYYQSGQNSQNQLDLLKTALKSKKIYVSDLVDNNPDKRIGPCPGDSGGGLYLGRNLDATIKPGGTEPAHVLLGVVSHAIGKPSPGEAPIAHYSDGKLIVACTNVVEHVGFIKKSISELRGKEAQFWG